ncbi:hypothetical protein AMECASPLE_016721 [Ameca splendens]|uniref:Uncharacterized protein n=1 Tax=Ameca splendens TaxID=208324 RepID=A0ABV0Z113_9TELE
MTHVTKQSGENTEQVWGDRKQRTRAVGSNAGRLTGERELHPGFLPGTDGTQRGWKPKAGVCEENHRDAAALMWLSGENSPLATDSPSKWRQFYRPSREWFANESVPSFFTCMPPSCSCDV